MRLVLVGSLIFFLVDLPASWKASAQNINYFGVAYSPYVKPGHAWNSYSVEDIKKMLRIFLDNNKHNAVSTYSMGVSGMEKI